MKRLFASPVSSPVLSFVFSLVFFLQLVSVAFAQPCGDYAHHPTITGQLTVLSGNSPVYLSGPAVGATHAYAGSYGTLHVFDVTSASTPSVVAELTLTAPVSNLRELRLRGDDLYATDPNVNSGGFSVFSVATPTAPIRRGTLPSAGLSYSQFALVPSHALVLAFDPNLGQSSIVVVDVSSPDLPSVADTVVMTTSGVAMAAEGNRMVVGGITGELTAFDVSDPLSIAAGAGLDLGARVSAVAVHGQYAYAATNDARLTAVDVSDPSQPSVVWTQPGYAFADLLVSPDGTRLYGVGEGIWALDLSQPEAPVALGNMGLPTEASHESIDAAGDLLYATTTDGEFFVSDWADPSSTLPLADGPALGPVQDLAVSGQLGFVLTGSVMKALSLADPMVPQELGSVALPENGVKLLVSAGRAYVVTRPEGSSSWSALNLSLFDVAVPEAMVLRGSVAVSTLGQVVDLALWGSYLYLTSFETADGLAYLYIFDVSDPDHPTLRNSMYLGFFIGFEGSVWRGPRMDVSNGLLFLGFYNGFDIYDLSTPTGPGLTYHALFPWHRSSDLQVVGDRIYVSFHIEDEWYNPPPPPDVQRTRGLHILDISTPTAPTTLGVYETTASPRELQVDGSHAFLAVDGQGVEMIDVRDPAAPTSDGYWLTFEPAVVRVVREKLYAAFTDAPFLQIALLPCGANPVTSTPPGVNSIASAQLWAQPSPFNPRTSIACEIERPGDVHLQIFDLRGRLIRTLHEGILPAGSYRFPWNGTDARGRAVASGSYRIILSGTAGRAETSAVLLK